MNYIRPITAADLPAILALSEHTGSGLTSLPANEKRLADRIERSLASFAGTSERADACYVFVLVDGATDKLIGISAIEAAVGLREAWYNFRVGTSVHASRELGVYKVHPTLFLTSDHAGHTELCSLFLDAAHRHADNGILLSKSRLLFVAEFGDRCGRKLIAELRGKLDADGRSPFWEGLGRHFFAMDFSRADYLTGIGEKAFVAELMPHHPLYTTFLPEAARVVIGQVHDDSYPAKAMLESEGFRYEGYIDIFDAGPTLECYRDNIRSVRDSRPLPIVISDAVPGPEDRRHLVCNRRLDDFRAVIVAAPRRAKPLPISSAAAAALRVGEGDTVRAVTLPAKKNRAQNSAK
jgi:arginine N-succinyltransferase